jgi:hypothetical protein
VKEDLKDRVMPIYKVKLKRKEEIAAETMAFYLEKPNGFFYRAGQYVDYTLVNPAETDAEGNTRDSLWQALLTKTISCPRRGCVTLRSNEY